MVDPKTGDSAGIFETGLSYLNVPGPSLSPHTIGQLLDDAARKWPNSECLYDAPMNIRLTYSQVKKEADSLASGLLKLGLNPGDRIGIWGPNDHRYIITVYAAAKIGVIVSLLNLGYEATELLYAINCMSLKCLVVAEPVKTRNLYKILSSAIPDMKIVQGNDGNPSISSNLAPSLNTIVYMGNERLNGVRLWLEVQTMGKQVQDVEKMNKVSETVQFDDIFVVIFTSGTTGQPKGAMISHFALRNSPLSMGRSCLLSPKDRNCLTLPLYHGYGLIIGTLYPIIFGSSVVIPSPTFSPTVGIDIVVKEKCTWLHGSPTMFSDMMNTPGFDLLDLSALKGITMGGASAAKTLLEEIMKKYKIPRILMFYGSTEALCIAHQRFGDPPETVFTSSGHPVENTEVKIIDPHGQVVPVGEVGEICVRSFSILQGYWEDPEKTREAIDPARWYHTGDAGYFFTSGHLFIVGRLKDMICRGGENVYPKETEDFLYQNLTEEIEEVYIFGVFDERLGEAVAGWILPKSGVTMDADRVKRVCEGQISRYKIPVYIKILQSKDDIPRTSMGKAQKNVMRQQYEKELGLNK